MVLGDDDFATIVAAIRQGRVMFDNIQKFLRYLLASNMGEVATVFLGVVLADELGLTEATGRRVVVPLLATQILWINLVTDSAPALALGVDPEIDDVMARGPRPAGGPDPRPVDVAPRARWSGCCWRGDAATLDRFLPGGLVDGHDTLATARTAAFTTLVLGQLLFALSARSGQGSGAPRSWVANRWLLGALLLGAALQVAVVEAPPLQAAFGTTGLDAGQWVWCGVAALLVVAVADLEKVLTSRRARRSRGPGGAAHEEQISVIVSR